MTVEDYLNKHEQNIINAENGLKNNMNEQHVNNVNSANEDFNKVYKKLLPVQKSLVDDLINGIIKKNGAPNANDYRAELNNARQNIDILKKL